MKHRKYFRDMLRAHFPGSHAELLASVDESFKRILPDVQFAATSSNPIDKRLHFCGYFLALIKTLDNKNLPFEDIRILCLEVVTEYVRPKNGFQRLLKRLPPLLITFPLMRPLLGAFGRRISKLGHPDGFTATLLTAKSETYGLGYGINITACGICKLFEKHNYRKFAPILCEVDKLTSGFAGLELVRTGTIANGAENCDFRFRKIKKT